MKDKPTPELKVRVRDPFLSSLIKDYYPEVHKRLNGEKTNAELKAEARAAYEAKCRAFFEKKIIRCRACRTRVTFENSAGGRNKRFHIGCEPKEKQ